MKTKDTRLSKKQWDEYLKKSDEQFKNILESMKPKPEPLPEYRPRPFISNSVVMVVIMGLIILASLYGLFQTCQCQASIRMDLDSPETNTTVDADVNINATMPCLVYYAFSGRMNND